MPPDPPREQGPRGLATPSQINATPTSKIVENPVSDLKHNVRPSVFHEFLIVDMLGLLLFTCLLAFFLFLGHVLSDLKTCLTF